MSGPAGGPGMSRPAGGGGMSLSTDAVFTRQEAQDWLVRKSIPLWLKHGVDWAAGAFHEDLDPATLKPRTTQRRLRVAARQVYVFTQSARLGVPCAEEAAALGLRFLREIARQPDGGYPSNFDRHNQPTDQARDLYDHAFVLLAYAHAGFAQDAKALVHFLDAHFIHPEGGLRESVPDALPRRQNPHMHLLEALLAAAETFADWDYLDRADRLIDLFLDRMFQPVPGALPEYFNSAMMPLRDGDVFLLEPGHHFEWVWLLDEHRRISAAAGRIPRETRKAALALLDFAERHGVDAQGDIAFGIGSDGTRGPTPVRIWAYTERLKAMSRLNPPGVEPALTAMGRFFEGVPDGLWCERRGAEGLIPNETCPASSLYHLTCGILECSPRSARM